MYADTALLIEALNGYAAIRERTAKRGAALLEKERKTTGADIRAGSVKMTRMLAEAAVLQDTADALLSGQLLPPAPPPAPEPAPAAPPRQVSTKRARRTAADSPKAKAKANGPAPAPAPAEAPSRPSPAQAALAPLVQFARDAGVVVAAEDATTGAAAEDDPTPDEISDALGGTP